MKMASVLFVVFMVVPITIYGADTKDGYEIMGFGLKSCGSYSEARKKSTAKGLSKLEELYFVVWLEGYITAYNALTPDTYAIMGATDLSGLVAWLDNYCQKNPHDLFADATGYLIIELRPKRLKSGP